MEHSYSLIGDLWDVDLTYHREDSESIPAGFRKADHLPQVPQKRNTVREADKQDKPPTPHYGLTVRQTEKKKET